MATERCCNKCKTTKPLSSFEPRKNGAFGTRGTCKVCRAPAQRANARKNYERHKQSLIQTQRAYYKANRARVLKQKRDKYWSNPDAARERNRRNWAKEENKQAQREYRKNNRSRMTKRHLDKMKSDPAFKLRVNLGIRTSQYLKRKSVKKENPLLYYVGVTPPELRQYFEFLMQDGMTWDNYGSVWHIDHIVPMAAIDPTNEDELCSVLHFSNLQPLWADENRKKGKRLDYVT